MNKRLLAATIVLAVMILALGALGLPPDAALIIP